MDLQSCKWVNKINAVIFQSSTECQDSDIIIPAYTDQLKGIRILLFSRIYKET